MGANLCAVICCVYSCRAFKGPTYHKIGISDQSKGNIGNTGLGGAVTNNNRLGSCGVVRVESSCARSPASRMLCLDCEIALEATRTSARVWCSIGAEMASVLSAATLKETIQQPRHQFLMEGLMRSIGAVMASVLPATKLKETMSNSNGIKFCPECVYNDGNGKCGNCGDGEGDHFTATASSFFASCLCSLSCARTAEQTGAGGGANGRRRRSKRAPPAPVCPAVPVRRPWTFSVADPRGHAWSRLRRREH
jgi:hypothetical protein